jgi:tRNA-guanine transglycosylase
MKTQLGFKLKYQSPSSRARLGQLHTAHGIIQTPAFVPVGTQATVKALTPDDLSTIGAQCLLANTYHLYLRPGADLIAEQGGLHKFMGWDGPIFTDSGGFQVFSLGIAMEHEVGKIVDLFADDSREEVALNQKIKQQTEKLKNRETNKLLDIRSFCKVDDEGSTFMSHLDGTLHRWTAEKSIQIQKLLGADIVLALDECTSPLHDYAYTRKSMERSHDWEKRSLSEFRGDAGHRVSAANQLLYGIIQGGPFEDLRQQSAGFVAGNNFDGIAIGGALVSKRKMVEILNWIIPELPENKPRHLLGIGEIDDLFAGVQAGMDTFDCAHPSRIARRGNLYISPANGGSQGNKWRINIASSKYIRDSQPIDPGCDCYTCDRFTRSYIRYLFWARELTYYRLSTIHNLRFIFRLMDQIKIAIGDERLGELTKIWLT